MTAKVRLLYKYVATVYMCILYAALYAMKYVVVGEQAEYTLHYHTILQTTIFEIRQNLKRCNTRFQNLLLVCRSLDNFVHTSSIKGCHFSYPKTICLFLPVEAFV